ncbi:MAG: hypothetical protein ACFCVK_25665 [Acidimicrobiales bacterium]
MKRPLTPDSWECAFCSVTMPGQALFCGTCGATRPTGAKTGPSRRRVSKVVVAMVGLGALGLAAGLAALRVGSPGVAVDEIVVFNSGDVFLVGDVTEVADPPPGSRILRDGTMWLGTIFLVAEGEELMLHPPLGYSHDGGRLVAYQADDGDDRFMLAVLDGTELDDITTLKNWPQQIYGSRSGTFLVDGTADGCSIVRLDGRVASNVVRSDFCMINPVADVGIVAEARASRTVVSVVELADGQARDIAEFDPGSTLSFRFSPTSHTIMVVGSKDGGGRTVLVDLDSDRVVAEADLRGIVPVDGGFVAMAFREPDSAVSFVSSGGSRDLLFTTGALPLAKFSPSGHMLALRDVAADQSRVWTAPVGDDGLLGPLSNAATIDSPIDIEVLDDDRVLVVSAQGVVAVVDDGQTTEVGRLDQAADAKDPLIWAFEGEIFVVSNWESSGVVTASAEATFIALPDLANASPLVRSLRPDSGDNRWLAVRGTEGAADTQTLVLVDLEMESSFVVDTAERLQFLHRDDEHLYYRTAVWEESDDSGDGRRYVEPETFRVPLTEGARPELIARDVYLSWPAGPPRPVHGWVWTGRFNPTG